ncbi:acyl-CoA thioester hydrolase/BAAT C-terminal domain-containing protein, partial [Rhizobiaceae sp. 2RAB30]
RKVTSPAKDFVAITGQSRGGELVLLLGATYPEAVSAIMAYVPAAYVHSAQSAADPTLGRTGATWTQNGSALPHLWENNRTGTWAPYDSGPVPRRHEYALLTAMADRQALERARIPVEHIRAPLLMVHGTDDGWWPTDYHCDVIEETLVAHGHRYPVERLRFEGAGHAILFPHVPTTT